MPRAPQRPGVLLLAAVVSLPVISLAQRGGRGSTPPPAPAQTPPSDAPKPASGGSEAPTQRGTPAKTPADSDAPKDGKSSSEPLTSADHAADYFSIADYNADGRLNYDEAQRSLRADRKSFAVYDQDVDGYISPEEFAARFAAVIELGGAFPPPLKKPDSRKAPRRSPKELLETYDQVPDAALDVSELRKAATDYDVTKPAVDELLATLDRDSSRKLELSELDALAEILSPSETGEGTRERAKTVLELFGKSVAREEREGAVYMPAQIPGPVPVFRRLDHDDDGHVTLGDFVELQRPIQVHVRGSAVFATIDTDGDGELSEAEFLDALRPRRP